MDESFSLGKITASDGAKSGSHEYVVVARRYRPQSFSELIGQSSAAQALSRAIETNRIGHAYLFTGARGVGKTSTARIFAKALNCLEGASATPCGVCDSCQGITAGEDMDVLEIDGASNRGIEEIRQLRSNVNVRPSRSRFKIYIIDEVHMLTTPAFNALLKTLEEPPEHVKFIFCTTDPEKIPITVLSRCLRFDFVPVGVDAILQRLKQIAELEGVEADDEALRIIARRAAGSMRDSQSLLEQLLAFCGKQITKEEVYKLLGAASAAHLSGLVDTLIARDAPAAMAELDKAIAEGIDVGQLLEQLLGYLRDLMAVGVGGGHELLLHAAPDDLPLLKTQANQWGVETVLAALQIVDQALVRMRQSTQVRILADVALCRLCKLDDLQKLADLIPQLQTDAATVVRPKTAIAAPAASRVTLPQSSVSVSAAATERKVAPESGTPKIDSAATADVEQIPSAAPAALSEEDLVRLWGQLATQIDSLTAQSARKATRLLPAGDSKVQVYFGDTFSLDWCSKPVSKQKLEAALTVLAGRPLKIELMRDTAVSASEKAVEAPALKSARQRTREVMEHPAVKEAMNLFDAEIMEVREGKK
jgi:DNA polymerase-3 subunit gamma/tau